MYSTLGISSPLKYKQLSISFMDETVRINLKLLIKYFSATILYNYIDIKQLDDIGLVLKNRTSCQEVFSRL